MKKIMIIALIIIIVGVGGFVIYKSLQNNDTTNQSSTSESITAQTSSNQKDSQINEVQSGEINIEIKNFAYSPASIKIKKGTKVTWTNQDSVRHDITPNTPNNNFVASDLLPKGESYSFTFDVVGDYSYFCTPHPDMKGSIEVVE